MVVHSDFAEGKFCSIACRLSAWNIDQPEMTFADVFGYPCLFGMRDCRGNSLGDPLPAPVRDRIVNNGERQRQDKSTLVTSLDRRTQIPLERNMSLSVLHFARHRRCL